MFLLFCILGCVLGGRTVVVKQTYKQQEKGVYEVKLPDNAVRVSEIKWCSNNYAPQLGRISPIITSRVMFQDLDCKKVPMLNVHLYPGPAVSVDMKRSRVIFNQNAVPFGDWHSLHANIIVKSSTRDTDEEIEQVVQFNPTYVADENDEDDPFIVPIPPQKTREWHFGVFIITGSAGVCIGLIAIALVLIRRKKPIKVMESAYAFDLMPMDTREQDEKILASLGRGANEAYYLNKKK